MYILINKILSNYYKISLLKSKTSNLLFHFENNSLSYILKEENNFRKCSGKDYAVKIYVFITKLSLQYTNTMENLNLNS